MPYIDSSIRSLPFQAGSDTSHDAAIAAEAFAGRQQRQYLDWLRHRAMTGIQGGTDREAEVEIPMRRSSVCARRNEAVKLGLVRETGLRRAGCAVWVIA